MTTVGSTEIVRVFLEVRRRDIAYLKFTFESYEGIAVLRTIDRMRAVVELLVVPDFLDDAWAILASIRDEVPWRQLSSADEAGGCATT